MNDKDKSERIFKIGPFELRGIPRSEDDDPLQDIRDEVDNLKKEVLKLQIFILRFLYNGIFGYLPVFIVLGVIYLLTGHENDALALLFAIPAVFLGNYFKLGERVYDLDRILKKSTKN